MTVTRTRANVGTMVIATCALTGLVLAVLPAAAQDTGPVSIGNDGAAQANDGRIETATGAGGLISKNAGAGVSDEKLTLHSDGNKFILEFSGTTRRRAVERLLAASDVVINWLDTAPAEELVEGRHVGSFEEVVNKLLSRTNFVIAYDMSGGEPRMASIVVHGRNLPPQNGQTLQSAPASYLRQEGIGDAAGKRESEQQFQARAKMLQKMKAAAGRQRR